ncbi:GNAT family N-acetyltransferase [Phycicoccus sp. BSK3Z-2]|uniref:GNAT family N-acetyltransferase n=1 Tax=Phycicoccus avicenniae TaxID=2828860 RepID=A0A941HZG2_9MICO|nr:GNAT family N-acetyltransferase [Phycicoccus avicenniae]MBR7744053.1 GNAT family N-acetyltransferase [Phycicoccus avicenniae]
MALVRAMTADDVDDVLEVQRAGSVITLADVFPQDTHPFPADAVRERWVHEVEDPGVDCRVAELDGRVVGFVVLCDDEVLHLGTAVDTWGSGLAGDVHDEALAVLREAGVAVARLRVFEGNERARRFYRRSGWVPTDETSRSPFAPYPVLRRWELVLG